MGTCPHNPSVTTSAKAGSVLTWRPQPEPTGFASRVYLGEQLAGKCELESPVIESPGYRGASGMDADLNEVLEQDAEAAFRLVGDRALDRQLGIQPRSASMEAIWFGEEDDTEARRRWPMWAAVLAVDEPFAERAARMERFLRGRRADGDGPSVVVTLDLEHFARWCEENEYHPADRRSRGTYMHSDEREVVSEQRWPPGRNDPCWCGSERKYKRCCSSLSSSADIEATPDRCP
jgi:hypothetical protein